MMAAVTMRAQTAECAVSSTLCRPKNRLRVLAQWLMWEASAAISPETKSGESKGRAEEKEWILSSVVMMFAGVLQGLENVATMRTSASALMLRANPFFPHQTALDSL
jgi:hypothetical protein